MRSRCVEPQHLVVTSSSAITVTTNASRIIVVATGYARSAKHQLLPSGWRTVSLNFLMSDRIDPTTISLRSLLQQGLCPCCLAVSIDDEPRHGAPGDGPTLDIIQLRVAKQQLYRAQVSGPRIN
jgi:hypothetical protein